MEEHKASAEAINADPTTGAALAVEAQIVAKSPLHRKQSQDATLLIWIGQT
ncbi:MAG: hypothetical protein ACLS5C_05725 [Waltera sp.]